jgi:hypothetical protein
MLVGGDFIEFIEAGGVNGAKFDAIGMSIGRECFSDLGSVVVTDAGIIDGKPLETVGSVKVVGHGEVCCCSTRADECTLLEYS